VIRPLSEAMTSVSAEHLIRKLLAKGNETRYQKWSLFYVESLADQYQLLGLVNDQVLLASKTGAEFSAPLKTLTPSKLHARYRRDDSSEAVYSPIQAQFALLLNEHAVRGLGEWWSSLRQGIYNRSKLRTPPQYDLLRAIVEVSLDDSSVRFTPSAIANALLGPRLALHPERARVYSGVEFHFRALAASKAIDREAAKEGDPPGFKIGETAIAELERQNLARTIETREQTNRYLIVMLTVASVVATALQAWVAFSARDVAGEALVLQRAQLNLELERDRRTLKEKADQQAAEAQARADALALQSKAGSGRDKPADLNGQKPANR